MCDNKRPFVDRLKDAVEEASMMRGISKKQVMIELEEFVALEAKREERRQKNLEEYEIA